MNSKVRIFDVQRSDLASAASWGKVEAVINDFLAEHPGATVTAATSHYVVETLTLHVFVFYREPDGFDGQ